MNPTRTELGESTSKLTAPVQRSDSSRLLFCVSVVCCIITLVAIVLAAVALSRDNSEIVVRSVIGQQSGTPAAAVIGSASSGQPRIWSIAVGHEYGAHEYIDTSGYLAGFSHDLIRAVCNAAGIICKTVWDPYTNCWNTVAGQHSRGGQGLLDRWYDACTGWSATTGRTEVFSFSDVFGTRRHSAFVVRQDDTSFDPKDLRALTKPIGFLTGFLSDDKCIARQSTIQGSVLSVDKIKNYGGINGLSKAILDGTVAAGFVTNTDMDSVMTGLKKVGGTSIFCRIGGHAMMTRKDSEFNQYWNIGFRKIKNTEFKKICDNAVKVHGSRGQIHCAL